ncbi:hypothetical protein SteCoe_23291 [Stentor coeruleus]|uniref:Protein kinase domain-containing protein n=1 Tax=Stentor coeruleus TaxID=5963 RepID=A0A1R2BKC4_9CILI|nr:hypothetical protein SteCoe_23291 [Stentor coeruleus]
MSFAELIKTLKHESSKQFFEKCEFSLSTLPNISLDELNEYNYSSFSEDQKKLFYSAILYRIILDSNCDWSEINPLLKKASHLFSMPNPGEAGKIFDKILIKLSAKSQSLKELIEMSIFLKPISSSFPTFSSLGLLSSLVCENILDLSLECTANPSTKLYKKLAKYIQKALEYGLELQDYAGAIVNDIILFMMRQNELSNLKKCAEKDCEREWKIIEILEKIEMESLYDKKHFYSICDKLEMKMERIEAKEKVELKQKEIIEGQKQNDDERANNENMENDIGKIDYAIDAKDIIRIGGCLNTKTTENFYSNIFKGKWKNKIVCLKIYIETTHEANFSRVIEEINIYSKLSSLRTSENCFLEYYGTCSTINDDGFREITLVMQWVGKNLSHYIRNLIDASIVLEEEFIKSMFKKLLNSFILLHQKKIFHLDIKPDNILIENNFFYIIDFDVAVIDAKHNTVATKLENDHYAGTFGYADPDIQLIFSTHEKMGYSKSKADVFSLGMTFYHFLVREKFTSDLNLYANKSKLMNGIDSLPYEWARTLLRKMLDFDRSKRISMVEAGNILESMQTFLFVCDD